MKLVVDRLLRAQWQYQPSLTAHDPNPPIALEEAAGGIAGGLFANSQTFYSASVSASYGIAGALFTDGDTFYTATVGATVAITGALYTDADTFFGSVVAVDGGPQFITGELAANDNGFFASAVSAAAEQSRPRGWDDAAPRRRPIIFFEEEPEPEPEAPVEVKRVKVTRKRVKAALESQGTPVWPLSVAEAVKALPEYVPVAVLPQWGEQDTAAVNAAITQLLRIETARLQVEAEEEDIELLLLAA